MMTYALTTRRRFLRTLAFLGAFGLLRPGHALIQRKVPSAHDSLSLQLSQFFTKKHSAAMVGREYLRCAPGEADARLLVDLICARQGERHVELIQANTKKIQEWLRLLLRQDFEQGHTVKVQGWILSVTEARLCALAALV